MGACLHNGAKSQSTDGVAGVTPERVGDVVDGRNDVGVEHRHADTHHTGRGDPHAESGKHHDSGDSQGQHPQASGDQALAADAVR